MALTADRNTPYRVGEDLSLPMGAGKVIYAGALVALNAGYAEPGSEALGLVAAGRAEAHMDNSLGDAGDLVIPVRRGTFQFDNSSGGDEITEAHVGLPCYIVDDATVAATDNSGTRSIAGIVRDVDANGVWVDVGPYLAATDPAAMRLLGRANKVFVPVQVASLVGSGAAVYRFVAPVSGTITGLRSVLNGALADGDATVTAAINGTPVTGGVLTIAQADSAAGDVDTAAPSAANAVTAGQVVSLTVGGSNTASVGASALVEITH